MEENTNRSLAINTLILYGRLILTSVFGLLTTRFALKALGVTDFGLFSLIGSIMSFIAIINTIMVSTSNRFIAVAIGQGDDKAINEQFNINLLIHIVIAFVTLLFAFPLCEVYINNYLNFDGDLNSAKTVLYISIIGSVISFISVPYNGLLMAKEKFIVFCGTETICSLIKLLLSVFLVYVKGNALVVYAMGLSVLSALPTFIYYYYCKRKFSSYVSFKLIRDKQKYKSVLSFSAWVGYGAIAYVAKTQGAAVLVNMFFNTIMNTALGIANTVSNMLTMVTNVVIQPITPQLTKSYAAGNFQNADRLLILSVKLGYFSMFVIGAPLLLEMEWLLDLWLGEVPQYAVLFSRLLVVDAMIISLNSGISTIIFADGDIKLYQISINTLRLVSLFVGYLVLKNGQGAEWLLIVYIIFSVAIFFTIQYVLHVTLNYSNQILFKLAYLPSILITIAFIPFVLITTNFAPFLRMSVAVIYSLLLIYLLGLSKDERMTINRVVYKLVRK